MVNMVPPKIDRLSIKAWNKGYVSAFDAGRMPNSGLLRMTNSRLRQNGTVAPRPGTVNYGEALPGRVLGAVEYTEIVNGNRLNKLLAVVVDTEDEAHVYTALDGVGWKKAKGAAFNKYSHPTFNQVAGRVIITNGEDNLAYFDIEKDEVIRLDGLPDVSNVTAAATGLTGSNVTVYYAVTAIRNGETARSATASVKVGKERAEWRGRTVEVGQPQEYVTVRWNKVANAEYYTIYAGISPSSLRMLDVVAHDTTGGAIQTFEDTGAKVLNANVSPPNGNSTAGVRAARSSLVAGRLFLLGDKDDPWKITFGGANPDTMFDFSAFSGGYIRINAGSKEVPVAMRPFRNGRGEAVPMVLCSATNGNGSLKYLQTANTQLGNQSLTWISVIDDNGRDGTDSPESVAVYNNALIYLSKNGFKTTLTKAQMQNVLSTESLAEAIQPDIDRLNSNYIHRVLGMENNGVVYFAVPVGGSALNQVWVLDLKRGGAWYMPWLLGDVEDLLVYGSSDGKSRVLFAIGDRLVELSEGAKMTDRGKPFMTDIASGVVKFSEDGAMWTSVVDITFILLRPTGTVRFSVSGKTEEDPLLPIIDFSRNFTTRQVPTGWNSHEGWNRRRAWGLPPTVYKSSSGEVRVSITKDIDEDVNWLQYTVSSDTAGADFELSDVIIQHIPIGVIFEEDEEDL